MKFVATVLESVVMPDGSPGIMPAVAPEVESWSVILPANPVAGAQCLVMVRGEPNVTKHDVFPDLDHDAPLSSLLTLQGLNALISRMTARGYDLSTVTLQTTLFQAVLILGQTLRPGIDPAHLKIKV